MFCVISSLLSPSFKFFQKNILKNLTLTNTIRKFTNVKNSDWVVRDAHP